MDKANLIRTIVVVLGFGVGGVLVARDLLAAGPGGDLTDTMYLVDVRTGDVFRAPVKTTRGLSIPARHPETKERVLFPLERVEGESGMWRLSEGYTPNADDYGGLNGLHAVARGERFGPMSPDSFPRYAAPGWD